MACLFIVLVNQSSKQAIKNQFVHT